MDVRVTRSFCVRVIIDGSGVNYENRTKNENYSGESIERRDSILIYSQIYQDTNLVGLRLLLRTKLCYRMYQNFRHICDCHSVFVIVYIQRYLCSVLKCRDQLLTYDGILFFLCLFMIINEDSEVCQVLLATLKAYWPSKNYKNNYRTFYSIQGI